MRDISVSDFTFDSPYPVRWTKNVWILGIREFPSFLVTGTAGCALIEAGVSALAPKILKDFESLDLPVPLTYLIAAHAHADHVSGLIRLKRLCPGLIFLGSNETARILEKEKVIQNFVHEDLMYAKYLARQGLVPDTCGELAVCPVKLDQEYEEGQAIDLGDVHVGFIDAPGHAPGNTAFRIHPDNIVLISDSAGYANSEHDILPLFFHHYQNSIASLEKIRLLGADHIGCGHNLIINGKSPSAAFLDRAIAKTREMKITIVRECDTEEKTLDFAEAVSEKMLDYGLFKSFSKEVRLGFLRLLIRRAFESLPK